jgi:hypothetical protein
MKRILTAVLAIGLLTACAGIATPAAARSESPKQSLQATGAAMAKAQSVRFDASGTVTLTLPQAVVGQLQAKAGSQGSLLSRTTTVKLKVSGAAKRPDQLDANLSATIGGLTINTEVIATGGHLFYKNPMTQKWEEAAKRGTPPAHSKSGASLYQTLLNTATSLTEVSANPSTLDGVPVDEYHIVPDLAKLFAQLGNGEAPKNPQASSAIQQLLQNATVTADVWTGSADHLVRRATYDVDATADLSQVASTLGSLPRSAAPAFTIPDGSIAHLTAHVELNLHDYNSRVTITAPTIAPSP